MRLLTLLFFLAMRVPGVQLPVVLSRTGAVRAETEVLRGLDTRHRYGILYSVHPLAERWHRPTTGCGGERHGYSHNIFQSSRGVRKWPRPSEN